MSREQDDKRKRDRDEVLKLKAERWEKIKALPNEKFTKTLVEGLSADEMKELMANKPDFCKHLNEVLYAPAPQATVTV